MEAGGREKEEKVGAAKSPERRLVETIRVANFTWAVRAIHV